MALSYEEFQAGLANGTIRPAWDDSMGFAPYWQLGPGGANPVMLNGRFMTKQDVEALPRAAPAAPKPITLADIQGDGMAINPATGKLQQVYARYDGPGSDYTDLSFDPAPGRNSLAGWAPGYYKDNGGGGALGDILSSVLDPVGNAAGSVLNPVGDKVLDPFFENGNMGKLVLALAAALTGGAGAGAFGSEAAPAAAEGAAGALGGGATGAAPLTAEEAFLAGGADTGAAGVTNLPLAAAPAPAATAADIAIGSGAAGATGSSSLLAPAEAANVAGGLKVAPEATSLESAIQGASTAGGASGITPGAVTDTALGMEGALGSGLVVPGVTGSGVSGAIGAAGLGLGAGALGAEALGTAAAGAGGAGVGSVAGPAAAGAAGTAAAAGAGSVGGKTLSDLLSGNISPGDITLSDLAKSLGTIGSTALGVYGANEQTKALKDIADRYYALGAPSRDRYEASYAPGFKVTDIPGYTDAIDSTTNALMRKLSTNGNPYGDPGALAEAQKYVTSNVALPAIQSYRTQNANTGGYSSFNTAAPSTATGAVNAEGGIYNAIGSGIADLTHPQPSLTDILKQLRGTGAMSLA